MASSPAPPSIVEGPFQSLTVSSMSPASIFTDVGIGQRIHHGEYSSLTQPGGGTTVMSAESLSMKHGEMPSAAQSVMTSVMMKLLSPGAAVYVNATLSSVAVPADAL